MAKTKLVIVYSPNQNKRRVVIIPDDDSQLPIHTTNIKDGEAVMVADISEYRMLAETLPDRSKTVDVLLENFTGKKADSDRCIVHAGGKVHAVICADPLIDSHPLGKVVFDVTGKAKVGHTVSNDVAIV